MREWVGRGVSIADPYDPALVRSAPRELRRMLADALAEEATARVVSDLGMGFTVWHDVAAAGRGGGNDDKLDHIVLSPSGLYAVLSEDFGGPVGVRRGELTGEGVSGAPVADLLGRMRVVARAAGVRFGGAIVVLPDDDLGQAVPARPRPRHPGRRRRTRRPRQSAPAGRSRRPIDRRQRDLRRPHPSAADGPLRLTAIVGGGRQARARRHAASGQRARHPDQTRPARVATMTPWIPSSPRS